MKESCFDNLETDLAQSRIEILQLADRVRRLVARQNERQLRVQQWRQSVTLPGLVEHRESSTLRLNLCGLCATERATSTIEHVGGCSPGSKCDQCGQPAIMWIEVKNEERPRLELARH